MHDDRREPPGLFVAGVDTGVGKTWAVCTMAADLIEAGLRPGLYKPACSGGATAGDGSVHWEDVDALVEIAGARSTRLVCPQRFLAALAPPHAARSEGRSVDEQLLIDGAAAWSGRCDVLLVEGAGGLLSPLSDRMTNADVAADLGYPLLIVVRNQLGAINHTLLTVEAAQRRGLPVAGIVLNDVDAGVDEAVSESNLSEITRRCPARYLGRFEHHSRRLCLDGLRTRMAWQQLAASAQRRAE